MTSESADESGDGRGGAVEPYEADEVLAVFEARADLSEPMTTRQIADRNGRSRSATYKLCMELAEDGVLRTKKTGMSSRVFWIPLDAGLFERGETHE